MCLGLPMVVETSNDLSARVRRGAELREVSLLLVGAVEPGEQVLVHLDTAIRKLEAAEAELLEEAMRGLEAAAAGAGDVGAYFKDLVEREPQLPPHLRTLNS